MMVQLAQKLAPMPMTVMLRTATAAIHQSLEKNERMQKLLNGSLSKSAYVALLQGLHSFHQPLEAIFDQLAFWQQYDFAIASRHKAAWLEEDLQYFNTTTLPALSHLDLPRWQMAEQLIGCLYVVEGATLGAMVINKLLHKHYGYAAKTGARFYAGYGVDTRAYWEHTSALINHVAATPGFDTDECIRAAHHAFLTYAQAMTTDA